MTIVWLIIHIDAGFRFSNVHINLLDVLERSSLFCCRQSYGLEMISHKNALVGPSKKVELVVFLTFIDVISSYRPE